MDITREFFWEKLSKSFDFPPQYASSLDVSIQNWRIDYHSSFPYLRAKLKTRKILFSKKDFERLWFLYKAEGEPKGFSFNLFCISSNIPYTAFYEWFKKTQKEVIPVEVEGIPEELIQEDNEEQQDIAKDKPKRTSPHKGSIMVTIRTREGLYIQKKGKDLSGAENTGREIGLMLSINELHNFYYLPELTI